MATQLSTIITGTGRCGTGYAARVLSSAGYPCGHETVFSFDGYDLAQAPGLKADSSWLAAPFVGDAALAGKRVVHLVRHPQRVIESLVRMRFFSGQVERYFPYEAFAREHLPSLDEYTDLVTKAAWFYLHWNRMILTQCPEAVSVRVEDGPLALLEAVGLEAGEPAMLFDDRTYGSRGELGEAVSLDGLPAWLRTELRTFATAHGYDLDQPPERPQAPRVFWAYLLAPAVLEHAVGAALNVAMYCGMRRYDRIGLPSTRVDRTRNAIAKLFVEQSTHPHDVLVMLDCDHVHPPDIVERLASHAPQLGVVGALLFRRSWPHDALFFAIDDEGQMRGADAWETDGLYRCAVTGSGAIAIRRWVFDKLAAAGYEWPWFRYEYPPEHNYDQSEDVFFARCCHAAGVYHYCDTGVESPHLIHAVADKARYDRIRAEQKARAEQEAQI